MVHDSVKVKKIASFSVSSWNIQGICSSVFGLKSTNPDFLKNIRNVDIMILNETWNQNQNQSNCPNDYIELIIPSVKHKHIKNGRDSGGLLIWYKGEYKDYISPVKKGTNHIWIKIHSNILENNRDVYLCAIYVPPSNSPYFAEEVFEELQKEISFYQSLGSILICGDLNARTGREPDFINYEGNKHIFKCPPLYQTCINTQRQSYDNTVNKTGKQVLQMCKGLGLYIVNGRIRGDSLGRLTQCSVLGSSVVDYAITDVEPQYINAFTVSPLQPFSDHSQITLFLKKSLSTTINPNPEPRLFPLPRRYKWTEESTAAYTAALDSAQIHNMLDTFLNTQYQPERENINLATHHLNTIFIHLAKESKLKISQTKKSSMKQKERWFDKECAVSRQNLRKLSNRKHRNPNDLSGRLEYVQALNEYKKLLRVKKMHYMEGELNKIEKAINDNTFWKLWKNINRNPRTETNPIQNGKIWKDYFDDLYKNPECQGLNHNQILTIDKLKELERTVKDNQCALDYPITIKEIQHKIKTLKNGKACGIDSINSEMLKHSNLKLQLAMQKHFNLVLATGYYPSVWNKGLISPIFKNGDRYNPNNYRGICVNSNLSKLFCSILNSRLITYLTEHNILSRSQIGFLPKHQTSDHIYTLHTLIQHHVHRKHKGKVFACFVDLKKAFDTIWHNGLFLQLLQYGIGGKIYDLIKSKYSDNQCCVKIGNNRTEFFKQGKGVHQGCNLSPTLFNIYINKLATLLEQSPSPGLDLQGTEIKFLMYADDLVLLSPTEHGLQQNLSLLETFCQNWAVDINLDKTKVMVFQKKARLQESKHVFRIRGTTLQHTMEYNYLGIIINASGSFNKAINSLTDKARRAYYSIKSSLYKFNPPITIWLKLFNSIIKPILMYGSEVWGPLMTQRHISWDTTPTEKVNLQFCKEILKVHRNCPNHACRAELGHFPLSLHMIKRSIKFQVHLAQADPDSYNHRAFLCNSLCPETDPLSNTRETCHLKIEDLQNLSKTHLVSIDKENKINYINNWKNEIKAINKLECYRSLDREFSPAQYLISVQNPKEKHTLTMYRLSDHQLEVEKGRHKKEWKPRELRTCKHCSSGETETEAHFLLSCPLYQSEREVFMKKITAADPSYLGKTGDDLLKVFLGEDPQFTKLAAQYVTFCHDTRKIHECIIDVI